MASAATNQITFQIYKNGAVVRTEELGLAQIKIGKIASNSLQIDDESVSRMHAMVEVAANKDVILTDLGSTKGTFVNGSKIAKQKLSPGDEVRIGDVKMIVQFEASADAEELAEAAEEEPEAAPPPPAKPALPFPAAPPPRMAPAPMFAAPAAAAAPASHAPSGPMAIPPAYGTKAYVPVLPPHIAEQVETRDGARAVEVAALFEDAVLSIKHFDNPAGGQVTGVTKGVLGVSIAMLVLSFGLFLKNYVVVSHEKAEAERIEAQNAALAAMGKDKDAAKKPTHGKGNPIEDILAVVGLVAGLGGLFVGLGRRFGETRENIFTIGADPTSTFQPPGNMPLPLPKFPLVRSTGSDYEMIFLPTMAGDMQVGGKTISIAELAGQARPASDVPGGLAMSIPNDARVNLRLGETTFNINSVPKPRTYGVPFHVDWNTQSYTIGVFTVVGLFMGLMFSVPPDPKSLSLDAFMNDQRLAKFLAKPEEQKPEEIPDWLKKNQKEVENSGGKRAKDTEGKMGKQDSKEKGPKLFAIKGPKDATQLQLAKEAATEAAKNSGVLGVIKTGMTGAMASIFGKDSAIGNQAEDALGGLTGTEVGEAYGAGGFGIVGSGRGGGGTGEGTIGLGNLGTIGRGSGAPGGGNYGARAGNLANRKAGAPEVVPGTAEVRGSLDKELIRRIIRRHINEVKFCYEKELTRMPTLGGRVMIQFTISPTGAVMASVVQSSTMNNPPTEQCIAAAVRRWEFPKPQGGIVVVTYPFVLKQSE